MKDRNPPPNPAPRRWTPEERQLWLLAKGAPPEFRLTTVEEITGVQNAVATVERARRTLAITVNETIKALDEWSYWQDQPDLPTAAANAAFDARRYERATTAAVRGVELAREFLKGLAEYSQTPVNMIDVAGEIAKLSELLAFLRAQSEARLERKT